MCRQNESKRLEIGSLDRFLLHDGSRLVRREAGLHGAIWSATAFALLDDHERAWELFGMLNPVHHVATPGRSLLIETLLGVNLEGGRLRLTPRMPKSWNILRT